MNINIAGIETTLAGWLSKAKADIVSAASTFLKVVPKIDAAAPTVEELTALVSPAAANWEKLAINLLDEAAKVVSDSTQQAVDGTVSIKISSDIVKEIQSLISAAKAAGAQIK